MGFFFFCKSMARHEKRTDKTSEYREVGCLVSHAGGMESRPNAKREEITGEESSCSHLPTKQPC